MTDDGPQWGVCLPCFLDDHAGCVRPDTCECFWGDGCWPGPPGTTPGPQEDEREA